MRTHVLAALLAALTLHAQNRADNCVQFYSPQREAALGAQLAKSSRMMHAPLESDAVRSYIDKLGSRLVDALSYVPRLGYHFEVTADANGTFLEPAALPGGYIFIPAGLILEAKDEAELAGTLAHAMVHIALRHFTNQRSACDVPMVSWDRFGFSGEHLLLPAPFGALHRAYESEADRAAVPVVAVAGYDPEGLARFVGRVQEASPRRPELAPLPPRDERVQAIEEAIRALPAGKYMESGDLPRIQDEIRAMPPEPSAARPAFER
jgi:beta-barrel assembly-enhancing protease